MERNEKTNHNFRFYVMKILKELLSTASPNFLRQNRVELKMKEYISEELLVNLLDYNQEVIKLCLEILVILVRNFHDKMKFEFHLIFVELLLPLIRNPNIQDSLSI